MRAPGRGGDGRLRLPGRRPERTPRYARWVWPAGLALTSLGWYAADSLRHRREQGEGYELRGDGLDVADREFMRAAQALTGAAISEGNDVELFVNGDRIFPTFLETIAGARSTLNLLTYVYWRGDIARELAEALCAKAKEGVEVNVLLDAVGTMKMEPALIERLTAAGVTVAKFRPPRLYALRRLANRTHRKVVVADGRVGLIGGVGIAEEWTGDAQDAEHWRDSHLRVRGPVVRDLQGAFAENWLEATGDVLVGPGYLPQLDPVTEDGGSMQLVRSAAGVGDTNVEALYFLAIACAREKLDLTAAYFAPRPAFIQALCDAAGRGVAVRILVPGPNIDKEFVRVAGRSTYAELLSCGVRLWEYQPTMLHAKSLCVDDVWSSVGSVNFDNRSFQLNDEVTLCVQSERFAAELSAQFARDLEVSKEIDGERWNGRPLHHRARERVTQLARREI